MHNILGGRPIRKRDHRRNEDGAFFLLLLATVESVALVMLKSFFS